MTELKDALKKIRETTEPLPIPPGAEQYLRPEYQLRPYQIQMTWNMVLCPAFLCGDAVGLGKTYMGAATMASIKAAHPDVRFLVYTTSSAQRQWVEEIHKFTSMSARSLREKGPRPQKARRDDFTSFLHGVFEPEDILVMRYSTLIADGEFQIEAVEALKTPICIIYDEATAFKSRSTVTNKRVRKLSKLASWRYGLSATPIENHLSEIYHIMAGLGLDLFGQEPYFKARYCTEQITGYRWATFGGKQKKVPVTVTTGYKNLNEFSDIILPYFWHRSQAEVGEQLPQLNTETIEVDMNEEQISKTDDVWNGVFSVDTTMEDLEGNTYTQETIKTADSKLTTLLFHQLISINPAILSSNEADFIDAPLAPKEEAVVELLNTTLRGSKTIVYTRFRRELERLKKHLPLQTGRNALYVHGDMDKDDRYEMMKRFQEDPQEDLILINQAAFQAVNLQQAANMICLDLPWSWGGVLQLVGRMVRLRSPHAICNLYIIKAKDSIDDHVIDVLKDKKGIFERILSSSASLGIFDENDHAPIMEGGSGFVNKLFDTLMLKKKKYAPNKAKSFTLAQ